MSYNNTGPVQHKRALRVPLATMAAAGAETKGAVKAEAEVPAKAEAEAEAVGRGMERVYAATHVVKRLSASQHGALKLARRFGDALVCVRYRHDPLGRYRYTTVELVVDEAPVVRKAKPDPIVMVRLAFNEIALRQQVLAHGALWHSKRRLWSLRRSTAEHLQLLARIVEA